jgi:hypothetical protein
VTRAANASGQALNPEKIVGRRCSGERRDEAGVAAPEIDLKRSRTAENRLDVQRLEIGRWNKFAQRDIFPPDWPTFNEPGSGIGMPLCSGVAAGA